jgi:hypothetical protein
MESTVAVQTKGRCARLQCCTKESIFSIKSFALLKEPRRIARWVISANQPQAPPAARPPPHSEDPEELQSQGYEKRMAGILTAVIAASMPL